MAKKRSTYKKGNKKTPQTVSSMREAAFKAAKVIVRWWKQYKHNSSQREPLFDPSKDTTPPTSKLSRTVKTSATSLSLCEKEWEEVVTAVECAELMMSRPITTALDLNWEEVVAAAEQAESLFFSKQK